MFRPGEEYSISHWLNTVISTNFTKLNGSGIPSSVLCGIIVGDSLKQKFDNLSDTVTDNVRGTGTVR